MQVFTLISVGNLFKKTFQALKDLPFQLDFVQNNPMIGFSLAFLNGTELYVIKCNDCGDLIPKCLRSDSDNQKWHSKNKIVMSKILILMLQKQSVLSDFH